MLLIHTPEDGERTEYLFKRGVLLSVESEPLEECGGATWGTYDEFIDRLEDGNLKARRALLWIFLRRQNPALRFVDLVVKVDELNIGFDPDQIAELRAVIADESRTDENRDQARRLLAQFGQPEDPESPALPEGEPGKDEPGESGTSSP